MKDALHEDVAVKGEPLRPLTLGVRVQVSDVLGALDPYQRAAMEVRLAKVRSAQVGLKMGNPPQLMQDLLWDSRSEGERRGFRDAVRPLVTALCGPFQCPDCYGAGVDRGELCPTCEGRS